jgi:hypothetical protein
MLRLARKVILLFVFLLVAVMKGVCHHTQSLVEMRSQKLFAWVGIEL